MVKDWAKGKPVFLILVTIGWVLMHVFAHFTHPVAGVPNAFMEDLYYLGMKIPILLVIVLWVDGRMDKAGKRTKLLFRDLLGFLNNKRFWDILFWGILAAVFIFTMWTQVLGHYIGYRGTITSLGLVVLLAIWLMRKFSSLGVWQSAFIGMAGTGFALGGWEMVYQIAGYNLIWGSWTPVANHLGVLREQLIYALPFLIICLIYRIKPTILSGIGFAILCLAWGIWIWGLDFWPVLRFEGADHTIVLNTPINWLAYYLIRIGQVGFIIGAYGFSIKDSKRIERI